MRLRRVVAWCVVGAAAGGCNTAERSRGRTPAAPAARGGSTPANDWAAGPAPASPAAGRATGADRGVLAGFVVAADGAKAKNVAVDIEPATGPRSGGAPVGVTTDDTGYFVIPGLAAGQSYVLTARVRQDGQVVAGGQTYAKTGTPRSQQITLQLVEGLRPQPLAVAADEPGRPPPAPAPRMPELPPTFGVHDLAVPPPPPAGAPGLGASAPADPLPPPTLPPDAVAPLTAGPRPDLSTAAPAPSKPPVMSVPPLTGPTGARKSSAPRAGTEFVLEDAAGVTREFPAGKWVLLDFMTTWCAPCTKAVPALTAAQDRLAGRGLEVVGVVCDDAPAADRHRLAAEYARKHRLNYRLLTEPADAPGALGERFGIRGYPTLVLLDPDGGVAWTGHPKDIAEVDRRVRE